MKLDTNSFHFKFLEFFFRDEATIIKNHGAVSLCKYGRLLIAAAFCAMCTFWFFIAALYVMVIDPIMFFVSPEFSAFNGVIGLAGVIIIIGVTMFLWVSEKMENNEPGVVIAFLRSIHDKTCVIMRVKE